MADCKACKNWSKDFQCCTVVRCTYPTEAYMTDHIELISIHSRQTNHTEVYFQDKKEYKYEKYC